MTRNMNFSFKTTLSVIILISACFSSRQPAVDGSLSIRGGRGGGLIAKSQNIISINPGLRPIWRNSEEPPDLDLDNNDKTPPDQPTMTDKRPLSKYDLYVEMERLRIELQKEQKGSDKMRMQRKKKKNLLYYGFGDENPDVYLNTPELIMKYGYPVELHNVTTEDGYILQMHRIPHGKNTNETIDKPADDDDKDKEEERKGEKKKKRVVFLQHGMFGTSADWILNSVDKSLAYLLADDDYDVWLGNARGNTYSQKHVSLKPSNYKFWKFSWHEMGFYDLPAELDYILNHTNSKELYYVGHSMGTTMFFVLTSTKPSYNSKIKFMAALGPAVYLNHTRSSAKFFADHWGHVEKYFLDTIGHGIFLPKFLTKIINKLAPEFCTPELRADHLCEELMSLLTGHDPAQTNYTQLPVILAHEPSTVSTRTGFHYFQNIHNGGFHKYDDGFSSKEPKEYKLSNVQVPVAIFWGQNDILCDPIDVERLVHTLPNVAFNFKVNFTLFNHVDFVFAKNVDVLINRPLLKMLKSYLD